MPFASMNSNKTTPINEIFKKIYWELAILKNYLFLSQPFWILFFKKKKKKKNIASSLWKLVTNYVFELMGLNFYYYDGLQPEMREGIINEHIKRVKWKLIIIFFQAYKELGLLLIVVGVVGLTFSVLVFYAEKDNKEKERRM